jgi:hypothetical protein
MATASYKYKTVEAGFKPPAPKRTNVQQVSPKGLDSEKMKAQKQPAEMSQGSGL